MNTKLKVSLVLFALSAHAVCTAQTFTRADTSLLGGLNVDARSVSFADIDNDGDPDILFQGNGPSTNRDAARQLLVNQYVETGELGFINQSATFGISTPFSTGWSAAWADYDGDGFVDVFLGQTNTAVSGNSSPSGALFRNLGGTGFTNVSTTTINDPGFHQNVCWGDFNNDGRLDLVIGMEGPEMHELYLQQADGSFSQQGALVGLHVPYGTKGYGLAAADYDGDGDLDVYISTCRGGGNIRNNFFENRLIPDGNLYFVDVADTNGTQFLDNSYHSEFIDFDNDGLLDLFLIAADQRLSKIFRNNGDKTFTDVDTILGGPLISNRGGDLNGGKAIDYDNDGDLDLFFHDHLRTTNSNGYTASNVARLLYRNDGNWNFVDVTTEEGIHNTNEGSYDSAWADVDLDGDMDLLASTDAGFPERLFISNASTNGNHWLMVTPRMASGNTRAIGTAMYATVNLGTPDEVTYRRDANPNAGTFNQSDIPVHFGLGAATKVDHLRVVWPGGQETEITNIPGNSRITITPDGIQLDKDTWTGWVIE